MIGTGSRFGLPSSDVSYITRIVIFESGEQVVGILVSSVAEVVYLRCSGIDSALNEVITESTKFIQGVSNQNE